MSTNNFMSRDAAIANVKRFFADTPSSDTVSLEDIFTTAGRGSNKPAQNRLWIANKLTSMREYNLVERQYSKDGGKKKLVGLKLTNEGKEALGRANGVAVSQADTILPVVQPQEITLETVYQAVKILREKMPSFDIVFEIKPKE
jgi:hypothetical protein